MVIRTTEQPKCNKKQTGGADPPSLLKKFGLALVKIIKNGLAYLLVRPSTWRFLMVHVPDLAEKVEQFFKDIISFLDNLF